MFLKDLLLDRINHSSFQAFSTSDFLDLDNHKNISKALEKLSCNHTNIKSLV